MGKIGTNNPKTPKAREVEPVKINAYFLTEFVIIFFYLPLKIKLGMNFNIPKIFILLRLEKFLKL